MKTRYRLFVITAMLFLALWITQSGLTHTQAAETSPERQSVKLAQNATAMKGDWERVWRTEGQLFDFLGLDENTVIGVGTEGMIVSSTDGGTYWHYQAPVDGIDLFAIDGVATNLWAVGADGLVLKSADGGVTWERVDAGVSGAIRDVAVVGSVLWIVGEGGDIRVSSDAGQTWTQQTSPVSTDLLTVGFYPDAKHGIAAGANGVVLVTADGGNTWQEISGVAPATTTLKDIFLAENQAWMVGSDGNVYFSQDMGTTWQTRASLWFPITRIRMLPGQTQEGWLVGLNGRMARTKDGGQTWDANRGDDGYHLYALGIGDANHIWVGGSVLVENLGNWGNTGDRPSWFVWGSADGGVSWRAMISGLYPRFYNVTAASEQIAYAVGQDLQVLKTEDAGYSWREIHQEILANPDIRPADGDVRGKIIHAISCAPNDPNDCHAAGRTELLIHTKDGGETWTREPVPGVGRSLYDIVMTSDKSGITVSRDYNYFTEDGVTWEGAFDNGAGRTHLDLDMINSWQGVVSTKKNLFDYTLDAGRHWKGYFFYQFGIFYNSGADALDYDGDGNLDYAWLVGCTAEGSVEGPCIEGAIIFNPDSVNDPNGWRALLLDPDVPRLQKIEMVDEQTGWVVGYEGTVLFTEDAGATWLRQPVPTDVDLYGLDVYNRGLAYAVGLRGDIIRYSEPDRRLYANPQWEVQIDGALDDWTGLNARHINSDDMDAILGETPTPDELDATLRVRWDDAGLYLGIEVTDATLVKEGALVDKVGIALDGLRDGQVGADDHTLFFLADGSAQGLPGGSRYGITSTDAGYTIEAFIPQEALGDAFAHLRKIGINIALFDARAGESSYASQMIWAGSALSEDPTTFGYITLFQFDKHQPTQIAIAQQSIDIDGDLMDWSGDNTYTLSTATADSLQGDFPADDADLSGDFRMRWWEDYLFLGVQVQDDTPAKGDAIIVSFDVDANNTLSSADVTYQIWPDGRVLANGQTSETVLATGVISTTGYILEVAIPADELGGALRAETPRQTLHFNYGIYDDDTDDGSPETMMNWQGASVSGVRADFGWLEISPITKLVKAEYNDARFQDTFLSEWAPTSNFDRLNTMRIRTGGIESPLVRVDIGSMVPPNAQVTLSYLGLYTVEDRPDAEMTARLYRMVRPWVVSEATWQQAAAGQPWEESGAKGAGDQAQIATDEKTLAPMGENGSCGERNATWFTITSDVQQFVAGEENNYGWVLRGDAGAQINYVLGSSRNDNPDCLPEIYFEYTFPSGSIPTPTPAAKYIYLPLVSP